MEEPGIESYANPDTMSRASSENSCTLGLVSDHTCNAALSPRVGSWNWGVNRTGLETEVNRQTEVQGFDSMPRNIVSQQQSAKHLAAQAVMAYRAGFPVARLSVT